MKKSIKFGGKERQFEANLGTADLYQMLTGKNLFEELSAYKGATPGAPTTTGVIFIYKRLAYVMNVQAETTDIPTMAGKMNNNDYLAWTFQFNNEDFTPEFTKAIAKLWRANTETHSEVKNQ